MIRAMMDRRSGNRRLLDLPLPVQSVHITTNVVSSNNEHGEVYVVTPLCDRLSVTCCRSMFFS